nr:TIR domain-containing protein [Nitrosomonas nitrosa]
MRSIFISYAHDDPYWRDRTLGELKTLVNARSVELFYDEFIASGQLWERELLGRIKGSDGFLIVVTPRYLQSEYINATEWPAIKKQIAAGKTVFWVLAEAIDKPQGNHILEALAQYQRPIGDTLEALVTHPHRLETAFYQLRRSIEKWAQSHATDVRQTNRDEYSRPTQSGSTKQRYLKQLISDTGYIPLGGLASESEKQLPLDSIYVTLEADLTTPQERLQTRALYHQLHANTSTAHTPLQQTISDLIREREPQVSERKLHDAGSAAERLEDLFQRERVFVILGDPGSGKSVMCRWIAHKMARALLSDGERETWLECHGRLPILVRVAKFAESLQKQDLPDGDELYAFIGQHHRDDEKYPRKEQLQPLFQSAVDQHEAVILLDGLDEIVDAELRGLVCDAIDRFITRYVFPEDSARPIQRAIRNAPPGEVGGNQVVVTSRITGYRWAPLRNEGIAHYLIRPLEDSQIYELCTRLSKLWEENGEPAAGHQLLAALDTLHDPAINALKRNPLLLTALFLYFRRHHLQLPKTRSELYRRLILDLTLHWLAAVPELSLKVVATQDAHYRIMNLLNDEDTILSLLSAIAAHMHQHSSSGRISKSELESLLKSKLSLFLGLNRMAAEPDLQENCCTILIWLVSEKLGALVEQTPGLYGFMHLTLQEYLAGRSLVWEVDEDKRRLQKKSAEMHMSNVPSWRLVQPGDLAANISSRLYDPRWREPLLFAFGEYSLFCADQWHLPLETVHKSFGQQPNEDETIAFARFIGEVPPQQIKEQIHGLRSVVETLIECYALHSAEYSTNTRWRLAEEVAALRRRLESGSTEPQNVHLGIDVDQVIRNILQERKDLAAPLAHLIFSRYWLSKPTLEVLKTVQQWDQAVWGWPILTALQQSIPENHHLTVDPIPLASPPSDQEDDLYRRKSRYDAVREHWKQQLTAKEERMRDALMIPTEELEDIWQVAQSDGAFLRVAMVLWGMAENVEAARWLKEYQDIAVFLQKSKSAMETIVDAEPERFLWRFDSKDVIYAAAVYLDTSPDKRHKRFKTSPKFGPVFGVRSVDPDFLTLVKLAVRNADPAQYLRRLIEASHADPTLGLDIRIAASLQGIQVTAPMDAEQAAAIDRAAYLISDAAFRALNVYLDDWFSRESGLTDSETVALYSYLLALRSRAGKGVSQELSITPGPNALNLIQWSWKWRHMFERVSDDYVYNFAVCLDTLGPAKNGQSDRPSSTLLVSHILAAEGMAPLFGLAQQLPLWGISAKEKVFPWEYWKRLCDLSILAGNIHGSFGKGLFDLFYEPGKMAAVIKDELGPILDILRYRAAEVEFVPSTPTAPQRLSPFLDWLSSAITTNIQIEMIAQEIEYRIEREGVLLDESLQSKLEDLAARLGDVSEFDRCLFLLRLTRHAEPVIASRWSEMAFLELSNIPDLYAQAEVLRRFRINANKELPPAFYECLDFLKKKSAVLAAFAAGSLGRKLCHDSFAWNHNDVLRRDAAWCSVSAFAALQEQRNVQVVPIDITAMWRSLRKTPQLELVRTLIDRGTESGLDCSVEALECLHDWCSKEDTARFHPKRLIPLLQRPTTVALTRMQEWAEHTDVVGIMAESLKRQAGILLAEAQHELAPRIVNLLLSCLDSEDDLMAFRAELVLAGTRRDADRKTRVNSLKNVPWQHLAYLCQKGVSRSSAFESYIVGLAINSYQFNDSKKLAQWCAVAIPGSDEERALLIAMRWVDVWDEESLDLICKWALIHPVEDRTSCIIQLAGRFSSLDRTHPILDSALLEIPKESSVRQILCPKWNGKTAEDLDVSVLNACISSINHSPDLEPAVLWDKIYSDNTDVPDQEVLRRLGSLCYYSSGSYPEQALTIVYPYVDQPGLAKVLVKWLEKSIVEFRNLSHAHRSSLNGKPLSAVIASLLSLSASLSEARPALFPQVADPEQLGPLLGYICLSSFNPRSMMGAITLLFRLRKIDLTQHFMADGIERSLLDAVIACLIHDSQTRQRTESVLPQAIGLQGGPVLDELGDILRGTSQRPGAYRSSVVLASARIIRTLIDTDALSPAGRKTAGELLRKAAQDERHRRPLYYKTGLGDEDSPISYVYAGMLHEELAKVLAKRSSRGNDSYGWHYGTVAG